MNVLFCTVKVYHGDIFYGYKFYKNVYLFLILYKDILSVMYVLLKG